MPFQMPPVPHEVVVVADGIGLEARTVGIHSPLGIQSKNQSRDL